MPRRVEDWSFPLAHVDPTARRSVIASVLTSPELFEMNPRALKARGIPIVFESAIGRTE